MADPKTIASKVQVAGYTGIQAGTINNSSESYLYTGAILGGEVNYRGAFARAEVLGGTALGAKAQIGYEFDLGRNMGLELSAEAQRNINIASKQSKTYDTSSMSLIEARLEQLGVEVPTEIKANNGLDNNLSSTWFKGMTKLGAKALYKFSAGKFKFGVGAEAGTISSMRPDITMNSEANSHITINAGNVNVEDIANQSKSSVVVTNPSNTYVNGVGQVSYKASDKLSLNLNGSLGTNSQVSLTAKYTF